MFASNIGVGLLLALQRWKVKRDKKNNPYRVVFYKGHFFMLARPGRNVS